VRLDGRVRRSPKCASLPKPPKREIIVAIEAIRLIGT
jgi:hypothetical protein